ncbi:MAG: glycosyltransferase family 39 protein [Bacilli bacterium]
MKEKIKNIFKGDSLCYIILFLVSCFLLYSYALNLGTLSNGQDTLFHASNISVIESTLDFSRFKFLPSPILPNIANNLGYGIGLFYPRLPHIIGAYITHLVMPFGGSVTTGIKLTHLLLVFFSALFMYKFSKKVFKNSKSAFFSALFYITSSYFISDILYRDAFAESFQFLFLPIIMIGLYELFYGKRSNFYFYFIIGYVGMINSHVVLSIFLTLAFIIYLLFHLSEIFKKNKLKPLVYAAITILILTLPELIPLLEHKLFASLAVFSNNLISSSGLVSACAISPFAYLFPFYEGTMIQFFINIAVIILLIIVINKRKQIFKTKAQVKLLTTFLTIGIIFLLLTTRLTPWQYAPDFLLMIQFPWRLEIVVIFVTSFLAATYFLLPNIKHSKTKEIMLIVIALFFAYIASVPQTTRDFVIEPNLENVFISEYGMGWSKEYLPETTLKNAGYYLYQENKVISKNSEEIEVLDYVNNIPNMSFSLNIMSKTTIEVPRLYYLGYNIKFKDSTNTSINIPYRESKQGMIELDIPSSGTISITYPGTKSKQISNIIRTIFLLVLISWLLFLSKKRCLEIDK